MKQCNDTITLYNAQFNQAEDRDVYQKTVIHGVHWYSEVATNVDSSGLKTANKYTLRIPVDADFDDKAYTDPISYAGSDPGGYFTLKAGDIIIHGEASEEHPIPSNLKKTYPECITVLGVTDMSAAPNAPHWKVVGA